jgi:hypothetical protein
MQNNTYEKKMDEDELSSKPDTVYNYLPIFIANKKIFLPEGKSTHLVTAKLTK